MKFSLSLAALAAATASAHTIFQRVSVDGADQGQLFGVRSASSNNPIEDVTSAALTCNTGLVSPVSSKVISVAAGAKVGTYWQHTLGENSPNDGDNPIASSHKGPVQVYLAKVDDAGSAETAGLKWTKVASEGLDKGVWGVDTLISGDGWWYFTLPSCIAPGDYLMRAEIIALHNAYSAGGAQFYVSCANIRVTGSGTQSLSGGVSFPGAYAAADPGITLSIYGSSGSPDNDGKAYVAPGPAVLTCGAGGGNTDVVVPGTTEVAPTSTKAAATTTTKAATTLVPVTTPSCTEAPPSAGGAALYQQCGGQGWTGPTTCASGTCTVGNEWYSQCLP